MMLGFNVQIGDLIKYRLFTLTEQPFVILGMRESNQFEDEYVITCLFPHYQHVREIIFLEEEIREFDIIGEVVR